MKNLTLLSLCFLLAVAAYAGKKNEWRTARLVDVKTQDMLSNGSYKSPNWGNGPLGGSFTGAPAHFITYNIVIETVDEVIAGKLSREISQRPPDLTIGKEIQWKPQGPKYFEVVDNVGKKYDFEIFHRAKLTKSETSTAPHRLNSSSTCARRSPTLEVGLFVEKSSYQVPILSTNPPENCTLFR